MREGLDRPSRRSDEKVPGGPSEQAEGNCTILDALALLDGLDDKRCEPGDPVDFDPEEFVMERLRESEWFEPD
jgi:hypothetical protein